MRLNNPLPINVLLGALLMTSCAVLDEITRPTGPGGEPSSQRVAEGLREVFGSR